MLPAYRPRVLDAAGLAESADAPVRWLWHDYLAAGLVTLLTGRGKEGKTTLLSLLLERVQSGRPLGGSPAPIQKAFVVSEESATLWRPRAHALGLARNVEWICRPFGYRPSKDEWVALLTCARESKADLVVFDSLLNFLPDRRENQAVRLVEALEPLHVLTKAGVAVLLLHHPRVHTPRGELGPRGTGALAGFVDVLVSLERPAGASLADRRRILRASSRVSPPSERWFELTPDGLDYVPIPAAGDEAGFAAAWPILQSVLEDFPAEQSQLQIRGRWPEDFDAPPKATLHRWLAQARAEGRLSRTGRGRSNDPYRYRLAAITNSGLESNCVRPGIAID